MGCLKGTINLAEINDAACSLRFVCKIGIISKRKMIRKTGWRYQRLWMAGALQVHALPMTASPSRPHQHRTFVQRWRIQTFWNGGGAEDNYQPRHLSQMPITLFIWEKRWTEKNSAANKGGASPRLNSPLSFNHIEHQRCSIPTTGTRCNWWTEMKHHILVIILKLEVNRWLAWRTQIGALKFYRVVQKITPLSTYQSNRIKIR